MSARDEEIRRVVAELDVHMADVEADIAVLKALLADDEAPDREELRALARELVPGFPEV